MKIRVIDAECNFFNSLGLSHVGVIILYHKEQDKDLLLNSLKTPSPSINENPLFKDNPLFMGRVLYTLKSNFMTDFLLPKEIDISLIWKKIEEIPKGELVGMFEIINKLKERN